MLHNLGIVAYHQGKYEEAWALHEECLAIHRELGYRQPLPMALNGLGAVALRREEYGVAQALFEESLAICREIGDKLRGAPAVEGVAVVAIGHGQVQRGTRLLGGAAALRAAIGAPLPLRERSEHERWIAIGRAA